MKRTLFYISIALSIKTTIMAMEPLQPSPPALRHSIAIPKKQRHKAKKKKLSIQPLLQLSVPPAPPPLPTASMPIAIPQQSHKSKNDGERVSITPEILQSTSTKLTKPPTSPTPLKRPSESILGKVTLRKTGHLVNDKSKPVLTCRIDPQIGEKLLETKKGLRSTPQDQIKDRSAANLSLYSPHEIVKRENVHLQNTNVQLSNETIRLLLARFHIMNTKDKHGHSPLHWASKRGYGDIVQLLLNSGANIHAKEGETDDQISGWIQWLWAKKFTGHTPLHRAAKSGQLEIVGLLIAHGASVNEINAEGKTPLDYAIANGHSHVEELLRANGATVREAPAKVTLAITDGSEVGVLPTSSQQHITPKGRSCTLC